MTLSSRSITRASALTLAALTFAACSDSTGPLNVSPDHLEAIGHSMAIELESGVLQLTAQDAMGSIEAPAFSVQSRTPGALGAIAFNLQRVSGHPVSFQVADPECGVPSQNPPTDTDGDAVPDNLTITFALPACRFVHGDGTYELTGVVGIVDRLPGTAGMAFDMSLDNFRYSFSDMLGTGFFRRDGLTSVVASATGLSQTVSWLDFAQINGFPSIGVDIDWSATFAAAQGSSITPGQPLPNGVYTPNGSVELREGNRAAQFTVTTLEALQYSAQCAAGVEEGWAGSPFTAGKVRVSVRNDGDMGYAEITYLGGCNQASVVYVAR